MDDTTILIDAFSQIFRAFFAIRRLTDSQGNPTNALFVFTRLLLELEKDYPCRRGAMLFDCGKVGFRLELNPEYKANRPPMPEDLKRQIPLIREMAEAFGWPLLEEPEYEADDLIGALAGHLAGTVQIVSSDKDLSQLVNDRVTMLVPAAKNGFEVRGKREVCAKFGVPPEMMVDYLALVGDSADNIPGVPGIGPKSAAALLQEFGPMETWLEHMDRLAGSKFAAKLTGQEACLRRNRSLIRLRSDLPPRLAEPFGKLLEKRTPDWARIAELATASELRSTLKDLPVQPPAVPEKEQVTESDLFSAPSPAVEKKAPVMEQGELF